MPIRRGDIYYAHLGECVGSEQGGNRPVLIIQNDMGNKHSPTVICAVFSSRKKHLTLPTHVLIDAKYHSGMRDSCLFLEQIKTIDKRRLEQKVGRLSEDEMKQVDTALKISLGIK